MTQCKTKISVQDTLIGRENAYLKTFSQETQRKYMIFKFDLKLLHKKKTLGCVLFYLKMLFLNNFVLALLKELHF